MKQLIVSISLFILSFHFSFAQAPKSLSASELQLQLKKMATKGSVLYIAAHPDDENTRLISYLANEKCMRTAYLSLTRGDGGQNLIGTEQGIELGVVRTQELLAARRTDGGIQFFTRAYDFGYSKSPKETFEKWNHDSILADVVFVIRKFRPDIIITRFATDGSGGHGHHTASAILAEEAFDAAGDPKRFPEQLKFVEVWQPKRLFYNSAARFWNPNADMSGFIKTDVGGYNELLGKSYGEIAAESRSFHRSQGFGSAKQRGEIFEYFKPLKGDTANLVTLFDRLDFSGHYGNKEKQLFDLLKKAESNYLKGDKPACTKILLDAFELTNTTFKSYEANLLSIDIQKTILQINGIYLEAMAESSPYVAAGDTLKIKITVLNRGSVQTELLTYQYLANTLGFCQTELTGTKKNIALNTNKPEVLTFNKIICNDEPTAHMYWLEKDIEHNKFKQELSAQLGEPYGLKHESYIFFNLRILGKVIYVLEKVNYKWTDPEKGENYRNVLVTPQVLINPVSDILVSKDKQAHPLKIILKAGLNQCEGYLYANYPKHWNISSSDSSWVQVANNDMTYGKMPFVLDKKGSEKEITLWVQTQMNEDISKIEFYATTTSAKAKNDVTENLKFPEEYKSYVGIKEIKYDHIPVQTLFPKAEVKLVQLNAQQKKKKIGYIPGAGDEVAACLTQIGYEVVSISNEELKTADLSSYETIITGVRAYNTNEQLSLMKAKLMAYVANGGTLLVQYNTNSFTGPFKGDLGPYPFKIARDRITNENATVNILQPTHKIFNYPNKIGPADFEGWIQERSIYHAAEVDGNYQKLLSMNDPDEKAQEGALIIAPYGKGHFIYTGLAFFRELPAGVPGAYRLFVNLIELK